MSVQRGKNKREGEREEGPLLEVNCWRWDHNNSSIATGKKETERDEDEFGNRCYFGFLRGLGGKLRARKVGGEETQTETIREKECCRVIEHGEKRGARK